MKKKQARAWTARAIFVVAVVFIVASVSQVIVAVFGVTASKEVATADELACTGRLRVLETALERASDRAGRAPEARARATFDAAVSPEWDDAPAAEHACMTTARSKDAWSALLRLRRTLEGRAEKDSREVDPVRRDFEARLP